MNSRRFMSAPRLISGIVSAQCRTLEEAFATATCDAARCPSWVDAVDKVGDWRVTTLNSEILVGLRAVC
jgi:hypothetical protein